MAEDDLLKAERPRGFILFCIAAMLVACSWALELTTAGDAWIIGAEHTVYRVLSATMGRSLGWDAFIAFAGGRYFIYASVFAGILSALWEAWDTRHRHYGRAFGVIALVIVATILVGKAADQIGSEIHRASPWVAMGKPQLSHGLSNDLVDFHRRSAMPDQDMIAWSFAVFALMGRLRRAALASLALLGIQALGNLSMGHEWLGTEWISILGGMACAGAWGMASRRVSRWVERKSESAFVRLFWRTFHRDRAGIAAKEPEPIARTRKDRRRDREHAWHDLVRQRVLPLLAPGGGTYKLLKSPPVIGETESRGSQYVRFLVLPDGQTVVLKFVRRPRGLFHSPSRITQYLASARASLVLERLGIPVPRTYWMETSGPRLFGVWHHFFSVEEFLVGRPLERENPHDIAAAMQLLARLHSHTAAGWGRVSDSRTKSLALYLLDGMRAAVIGDLERAAAYIVPARPTHDLIEAWWHRFEREFSSIAAQRPAFQFRMIHGDVTWRNFHFDRADHPRIIDFVTVRYDLAGTEIVKAAVSLNDGAPESVARDWRIYFATAGPEAWAEFRQEAPLALAMYSLREFSKGRVPLALRKPTATQLDAWLTTLFESGPLWGDAPEATDWRAISALMQGNSDARADEGIA